MMALTKKFGRPALVFTFIAVALLATLVPHQTEACCSLFSIEGIVGGVVGWIAFVVNYIAATVAGVFIALITYFVGVILVLNTNVVNSFAVQTGFSVTLAVANLGFILGIIVIAIATILRSSTYGIKQILWKLIVAAILVNFSLVICAPIISFADQLTSYFLTVVPGGGGGTQGFFDFSKALAGAFTPQRGLFALSADENNLTTTVNGTVSGADSGTTLAAILTPLLSMVFVVGFLIVIVITLAVFLFQLLARYVILGILLILMPIAWLSWVFPQFQNNWSKWWHEFLRWTFFAPTVMFFLWLAIMTSAAMTNGGANDPLSVIKGTPYQAGSTNDIVGGISKAIGNFVTSMAGTTMQMIIVLGLAIGGMIAADKLSITGAKSAMTAAKASGDFVKTQAKKGGRIAYQRADKGVAKLSEKYGKNQGGITQRLQEGKIGALKYIPLAQRGASLAGRAIERNQTNEALVKDAQKKVPKDAEQIQRNLNGDMNYADVFAHLNQLLQDGKLTKDTEVRGKKISDFMDSNPDLVARYGQGKFSKDVDKALGGDKDTRALSRPVQAIDDQIGDYEKARDKATDPAEKARITKQITDLEAKRVPLMQKLDASMEKFVKDLDSSDIRKMNLNDIYADPASSSSKSLARNVAQFNPTLTPSMLGKMNGKAKRTFREVYMNELDSIVEPKRDAINIKQGDPRRVVRDDLAKNDAELAAQETLVADLKKKSTAGFGGAAGSKKDLEDAENKLKTIKTNREKIQDDFKRVEAEIDKQFAKDHEDLEVARRNFKRSIDNAAAGFTSDAPTGGPTPAATP